MFKIRPFAAILKDTSNLRRELGFVFLSDPRPPRGVGSRVDRWERISKAVGKRARASAKNLRIGNRWKRRTGPGWLEDIIGILGERVRESGRNKLRSIQGFSHTDQGGVDWVEWLSGAVLFVAGSKVTK